MIIREVPIFSPSAQANAIIAVFSLGILTAIALGLGMLYVCARFILIVVGAFAECVNLTASLYSHSDSITKLLMWLLVVLLIQKLTSVIANLVRRSLFVAASAS